jgi:hypothetical protein
VSTGLNGLRGEGRLEPGAVEDVADVAFGNTDRRSVRRAEDDPRDPTCDPWRIRVRPYAFAAAYRASDGVVTLEDDDQHIRCSAHGLTCRDQSGWPAADNEKITILDAHRLPRELRTRAVDHREREYGAGRNTLLTPCADWRVYMQSGAPQLDGVRWTERDTQTALIAAVRVDNGNERGHEARHARDVTNTPRLCQANALLALTRSTTLRPDAPLHDPSVPLARLEPLLDALAFFESGKIVFPGKRDCG